MGLQKHTGALHVLTVTYIAHILRSADKYFGQPDLPSSVKLEREKYSVRLSDVMCVVSAATDVFWRSLNKMQAVSPDKRSYIFPTRGHHAKRELKRASAAWKEPASCQNDFRSRRTSVHQDECRACQVMAACAKVCRTGKSEPLGEATAAAETNCEI